MNTSLHTVRALLVSSSEAQTQRISALLTRARIVPFDHADSARQALEQFDAGGIDGQQSELIQNAIEFNDLEAWDVLTPRVDIKAIEIDEGKDEIAALFLSTGFSRLPVYEDDLDNIVGVLNQKDFHNYIKGTDVPISSYVKPVIFVAGSMKISQLLKKLQLGKTHIAIIVDEYGGTSGLVTMEDIIEELVGEIYDEHDAVQLQDIVQQQDGSYRVLCGTNLDKMFDYFDVEEDVDATTVNGWVVLQLDKLPSVGDSFVYEADYKRFEVKVTKADSRKALEINTSGIRQSPKEALPSVKILKMFKEAGGRYLTVGSDAHLSKDVGADFDTARQMALEAGFRHIALYEQRKPILVSIED